MRRVLLSLLLIALFVLPAAFAKGQDSWENNLFWGIDFLTRKTSGPNKVFVLKVDLWRQGVRAFVNPESFINKTVSQFVNTYGVQVGINTAFFDIGNTGKAIGYFESQGRPYVNNIANDSYTTAGISADNVFMTGIGARGPMYNAFSSYPVLVVDGKNVAPTTGSHNTVRHPRTAVGIDRSGRYLIMFVVDGRQSSSVGMTTRETADQLISLGVHWGLSLDGGGSSTMVIQGRGLVNRPAGGTYQRPVASSLGIFAYPNRGACPVGLEVCDSRDNDCDGEVDEGEQCDGELTARLHATRFDRTHSDIDGDGKMDYCARSSFGFHCHLSKKGDLSSEENIINLSNANGWHAEHYYQTVHFADINGDKLADVCARGSAGLACWLSKGTSFVQSVSVNDFTDGGGWTNTRYYSTIRFADINGDGKDDVCARWGSDYGCMLSTGSGFGPRIGMGDFGDAVGWAYPRYYGTIQPADINGDGKYDICGRGSGGIVCFISKGTSFGPKITGPAWSDASGWNNLRYWSTIQFGDINGDGKDDLCGRDSAGMVCHLSTGSGFGAAIRATTWSDASGWADPSNYMTIQLADINGDKKLDICGKANVAVGCVLSEGTKFGASVAGPPLNDSLKWNDPSHYRSIRYGDYNGDHKADLCARDVDGVVCYPSTGNGFGGAVRGAGWADAHGWGNAQHAYTFRFAGLNYCVPQCSGKTCGPNGCDGSCGTCSSTESCNAGVCKPKCSPNCTNKQCGPDGCGGSCGGCKAEETCNAGVCSPNCTPNCTNKQCGGDGCGKSCGSCDTGLLCVSGRCVSDCTPNCGNRQCGDDGCGQSCGECAADKSCNNGVCIAVCVPDCTNKQCGGDGCKSSCGECDSGAQCNAGECQVQCVAKEEICDLVDNDCDGAVDEEGVCKDCPLGLDEFGNCLTETPADPMVKVVDEDCSCTINKPQKSGTFTLTWLYALLGALVLLALRRKRMV